MEQFISLVESYGLLVVLSGLLASILCGCVKLPIVNAVKKKNLGEKATTNRISSICTILVAVFSVAIIVTWSCLTAGSFKVLLAPEIYSKILLSISFAKIAYMLYEGVGIVSIKKGMHILFQYLKTKMSQKKVDSVSEFIDGIQTILIDDLHLPLTDHQKDILRQGLKKLGTPVENEVE